MKGNDTRRGRGINRRQTLATLGTAVVGTGLFTGIASASDLRQVNFCGCSQVCFTGGDPSNYLVWVGYRADDAWTYERVTVRLADGDDGTCYTVEEAEDDLDLDDAAEAKLIAVSDFASPSRYVGNPGTCAAKPLDAFVAEPPSIFNGFINDTGDDELSLAYGTFRNTEVVHGGCGKPGRDKKDNNGKGNNGRGR